MAFLDPTLLILLVLATLGIFSHNMPLTWAILTLFIVRITPMSQFFPWIEKYALTLGILILTIGMIAPIASGKINVNDITHSFLHWKPLLAIVVGVVVSYLGGRGVSLMTNQPSVVAGLLVGTVLGVALFKGIPVGPLVAAGLLSLLIGKQ
ncbi:DUF441 domain-containing protein [Candidatus Fukatsuia symbiotica]|uniref:UPF0756 membrane protein CCS41_06915 n=1 Tax=Candidatus Fukatsuia symbiotica TaxID=1878942 RepID=A0A2U8I526_9GAMM|nr:DUF441 domain-containing protein [Candidatus Fukatsuia symbiotica]AWK14263.1 hypothetical protein CCS41_06915 [Candidatus Fukatsuia symbiotica]MEA9444511.1 DUF441 domain-containing protein [Candidatus Fukatsuia symbiotica]